MSAKLDRRHFLHAAVGGGLGVAASAAGFNTLGRLNAALASEQVQVAGGAEAWRLSVCSLCPGGCGLKVRTIGKRAVKIQGNPLHPVNQGGLCPKGIAGLQELYHPDRLRVPMKNTGTRTAPRWRGIHWEEAMGILTAQLRRLRATGEAHELVFVDGAANNLSSALMRRFVAACGSPNYFTMPAGSDAARAAAYFQQGVTQPLAYDLEGARYVISFGANLLEGWGAPVTVMRAFGRWRDSESGRRTKFVQAESRFSLTAARADEWIALRPGTEAAFALGIAYVLISEGLYDEAFVRDRTFGFDDWQDADGRTHTGFRSLVLSEYRLNEVAALTQVPAERILRVAREFGGNRPALALGDWQTSTLSGNTYAAMAVHSLNALVGSIDAPGGVLVQPESPLGRDASQPGAGRWPRVDQPEHNAVPGSRLDRLPQVIASGKPYPVKALILNGVDPVYSLPNGEQFREMLDRVPFVAAFTPFMDDTSFAGDLVLPVATGLERWQDSAAPPGFPYALQAISPPVIAPRHGTRHPADIVLDVARGLGGPPAEELKFENFEAYLRNEAGILLTASSGSTFGTPLEGNWNRLLERSGWWAPTYSNAQELWEQFQQRGGWWEPSYRFGEWDRAVQTKSARFEFYSQALAAWAGTHPDATRSAGFEPGDDRAALPHQPRLPAAATGFPFLLVPVEVLPLSGGQGGHLPYLQQIASAQLFEEWESWLEIHPETASELGLEDGEEVWVESRRARARVRLRLFEGARRGVVHLPLGYGRSHHGSEWARGGVNVLALLEEKREPVTGFLEARGTYVKVYRA